MSPIVSELFSMIIQEKNSQRILSCTSNYVLTVHVANVDEIREPGLIETVRKIVSTAY